MRFIIIATIMICKCRSEWVQLPKLEPLSPNELEPVRRISLVGHNLKGTRGTSPERKTASEADSTGMINAENREASHGLRNNQKVATSNPNSRNSLENNTISEKQYLPSTPATHDPPDSPNVSGAENRYPNQTFTFLDPLVESLLMKVHHTLIAHVGQTFRQRVHYLQSLQNNILNQIWKRSQRLWMIDRSSEARGNEMISFPSLEGALLTISFLTFAVFLIKIVKQFIQAMQGTNATTIEVPVNNKIRHKRDAMAGQAIEILRIIDEFHFQHQGI